VEVRQHHPEQAQQAESQQRVIDPQPAARVSCHANRCSPERLFGCNNSRWHRRVSIGLLACLLLSGCLPDPHRQQTGDLFDQLNQARQQLAAPTASAEACPTVGDVVTRLNGEPGLIDIQPAWSQLAQAADALQAVCGQTRLLAEPSIDSAAARAARQGWQAGIQRELGVACEHLRAAAAALARPEPC
jgi:hypothetical protein